MVQCGAVEDTHGRRRQPVPRHTRRDRLVNGGGGHGKLVLLRMAKRLGFDIGEGNVIRRIRFPLHDHCKKNLGWSNAQVLMRFTLLQLVVMPVLLILLIKIR